MPDDLEINGDKETFLITVEYDTLELYGVVNATREVTLCRPDKD